MIKIFTTDKDGKITLTKQELQDLVNEAYWEGYNTKSSYTTIRTPSWTPYTWTEGTLRYSTDTVTTNTAGKVIKNE